MRIYMGINIWNVYMELSYRSIIWNDIENYHKKKETDMIF